MATLAQVSGGLSTALSARLREQWWQLRRRSGVRWQWGLSALAVTVVTAWVLSGHLDAVSTAWIDRVLQWPLLCVAVAAAIAWLGILRRLQAAARSWYRGWWAAQPAAAGLHGIAISLLALSLAMPIVMGLAVPLLAIGWRHPQAPWHWLLGVLLLGVLIGIAASAWMALRTASIQPDAMRIPRRTPLFGMGWLQGMRPDLPGVLHWQQRQATQQWRTGHGAAWIVLPLAVIPSSTSPGAVLGMMLGLGSANWCAGGLRAAWQARASVIRLLAATPCEAARIRHAAWRYPMFVALAGLTMAAVASAMTSAPASLMLAWLAVTVLMAVAG